jgi:hypothetical protein
MLVHRNDQTALHRKRGRAQGILRAAGCWHTEFCGPPRPCSACWRRHTPARCGWRRRAGGRTLTALLWLGWRCPVCCGTVGGRRRYAGRSGEERGKCGTQAIDCQCQGGIAHISYHDHTAWHPLPSSTLFRVAELGHRPMAVRQNLEKGHHGFCTDPIALGSYMTCCCASDVRCGLEAILCMQHAC